jgi:hypothetical protein
MVYPRVMTAQTHVLSKCPVERHHCRLCGAPGIRQWAKCCIPTIRKHLRFLVFGSDRAVDAPERGVELVKTLAVEPAIFRGSELIKGMAKICSGPIAAVFLLQSYYVRELLIMEVIVVLGFVSVALIVFVYALICIAALGLVTGLGQLVLPFARHLGCVKSTTTRFPEAEEEVY